MKIPFETIKEIAQGVAYISKNGNCIQFHRFNESEERHYSDSPWLRHYSTSGVKLVFSTDSTKIKLKVNVEEATPTRYFSHDIFCNQKYIGSIRNFTDNDLPINFDKKSLLPIGDFELGVFEAEFNLEMGLKEISIVFPWSVNSMLEELTVDDGAAIYAVKNDCKIISYGDSITYGASAVFPSNRYMAKLSEDFCAEEICKAVGGEIFCPELLNYANEKSVKYITVAYGTNDIDNDFENFEKRCNAFFEKISRIYSDALIFAISPIWRNGYKDELGFARMKKVENQIRKTVSQYNNIIFVDGSDLVPCDEFLFADRCLHPNDEGFKYYYENLKAKIQKYL